MVILLAIFIGAEEGLKKAAAAHKGRSRDIEGQVQRVALPSGQQRFMKYFCLTFLMSLKSGKDQ